MKKGVFTNFCHVVFVYWKPSTPMCSNERKTLLNQPNTQTFIDNRTKSEQGRQKYSYFRAE